MNIKSSNTKTIVITNEDELNIEIRIKGKIVEYVDSIKHVEAIIDNSEKLEEEEINNRILMTTNLFHSIKRGFINKREISKKSKMTVYKRVLLSTVLYGCG